MSGTKTPPPVLTTERLLIRPFTHKDDSFIVELLNDRDFIEQIQDRGVRTHEQAREYLTNGPLDNYAKFGFGLCCVVERHSQNPVGMCGLIQRETLPAPDIGYAFLPTARGKGYALEASLEIISFARATLGLERVLAVTSHTNDASQRLLKKLGFRYLKPARFEPDSEYIPCFELKLLPASKVSL